MTSAEIYSYVVRFTSGRPVIEAQCVVPQSNTRARDPGPSGSRVLAPDGRFSAITKKGGRGGFEADPVIPNPLGRAFASKRSEPGWPLSLTRV